MLIKDWQVDAIKAWLAETDKKKQSSNCPMFYSYHRVDKAMLARQKIFAKEICGFIMECPEDDENENCGTECPCHMYDAEFVRLFAGAIVKFAEKTIIT